MSQVQALYRQYQELSSENDYNIEGLILKTIEQARTCHEEWIQAMRKLDTYHFLVRSGRPMQCSWELADIFVLNRYSDFQLDGKFSGPSMVKSVQDLFRETAYKGYFIEIFFPMLFSEFTSGDFCMKAYEFIMSFIEAGDLDTAEQLIIVFLSHSIPLMDNLCCLVQDYSIEDSILGSVRFFNQWQFMILKNLTEVTFKKCVKETLRRVCEYLQCSDDISHHFNTDTIDSIDDAFFGKLYQAVKQINPESVRDDPQLSPLIQLIHSEKVGIYLTKIDYAIASWIKGNRRELQSHGDSDHVELWFTICRQVRYLPVLAEAVKHQEDTSWSQIAKEWQLIDVWCQQNFCDPIRFVRETKPGRTELLEYGLRSEISRLEKVKARHELLKERTLALQRLTEGWDFVREMEQRTFKVSADGRKEHV